MIYKATTLVKQAFDANNLKYVVEERDNVSGIVAGFSVKSGQNMKVQFVSVDEENTVAIRLFGLVTKVADEDRAKIYDVINKVHIQYRFLKFFIDKDGDLNVSYDLLQSTPDEAVGPMCVEVFARIMEVVNKVYPDFMRALWS